MSTGKRVTLSVGSGGKGMQDFIKDRILAAVGNDLLASMSDAAHLSMQGDIAFTTDTFVVKPEFFPGGDIGKLAVCGTVNDLAVSGAEPKYLSMGLVIPEGYPLDDLDRVLASFGETARRAGVMVACGDTKVVEKGALDGLIINTAGIGQVKRRWNDVASISPGDVVIVTSDIARHGVSVLLARGDLGFSGTIESDCAPLGAMLSPLFDLDVKFCRDATRGGLAAVLNEIASEASVGFDMQEGSIPLRDDVGYLCEMLGFDPLAVANEGVAVVIAGAADAEAVLERIRASDEGSRAMVAGIVNDSGRVVLETTISGRRSIDMPSGELLPRIC